MGIWFYTVSNWFSAGPTILKYGFIPPPRGFWLGRPTHIKKENGIYIKKVDEKSTWLTTGILKMSIDDNDWLETKIFDIKNEEIAKIQLIHTDKSILSVSKTNKENENFVIDNLPKEETPKSDLIANFLSYFLVNLTFEDVVKRREVIEESIINKSPQQLLINFCLVIFIFVFYVENF